MAPTASTLLLLISSATAAGMAHAQPVEIFAAGSLRGVVTELAKEMASDYNIEVKPSFGGSGSMRERIEKGEKADLLLSADLGSPRQLESQGRTTIPTTPFARNRMCIMSRLQRSGGFGKGPTGAGESRSAAPAGPASRLRYRRSQQST
jgi:ABC-type molybdate transport system substrate-binding protein